MLRTLMIAAFIAVPMTGAVPPKQEPEKLASKPVPADPWCGYFESVSKGPDGGPVVGVVTIRKVKQVYTAVWNIEASVIVGVGQTVGDILVIGWAQQEGSKVVRGCTVFAKTAKGLGGHWCTVPGDGNKHEETLTLLKAFAPGE